jgi:ribulose-5-phosphate 4-epimerase/fuculose-1-phosphate aldolase
VATGRFAVELVGSADPVPTSELAVHVAAYLARTDARVVVLADTVELAHKRVLYLEEAATFTYRAMALGRGVPPMAGG